MKETKKIKINGIVWEITPVTYEDLITASDEGYHVSDYAWRVAKYSGERLDTNEAYWLSFAYIRDIKKIMASSEKHGN